MDRLALLEKVNAQESLAKAVPVLRQLIPVLLREEKSPEIRRTVAFTLNRLAAEDKDAFDVSLLCAAIVSYARTNKTYVLELAGKVLSNSPSLLNDFVPCCIGVIKNIAKYVENHTKLKGQTSGYEEQHWRQALSELTLIVKTAVLGNTLAASTFGRSKEFVETVADIYKSVDGLEMAEAEAILLLQAKEDILEAVNACINAAYLRHLPEKAQDTLDIILSLSEADRAPELPKRYIPLVGPSGLLNDLDFFYNISDQLAKTYGESNENEELALLVSTVKSMTDGNKNTLDHQRVSISRDQLQKLIDKIDTYAATTTGISKGKEKEKEDDIDIKVSLVRDVLPDAPAELVTNLLKQNRYEGSTEKVIEALLEESDWELLKKEGDMIAAVKEPVDIRRLKVGKMNPTEFLSENKKAGGASMRETILSLVEKMEEEDLLQEEYEKAFYSRRGQEKEEVLAEFDDEEDEEGPRAGVQIDESESEDEENNPHHPRTREILEQIYMSNPGVFARDAQTRRSDARAKLRVATSCTDEVLEGWRIMFERHPRKDKILQDRAFGLTKSNNSASNTTTSSNSNVNSTSSSTAGLESSTSNTHTSKTKTTTNHKPQPRHQRGRGRGTSSRGRRD